MKKKFLALVLTLAMVLSLVPATALATNGTQEGNNQGPVEVTGSNNDQNLTMKKTVIPNTDGTYTVHLESYATGEVTNTSTTKSSDIVLLLDVSGSMSERYATKDTYSLYDGYNNHWLKYYSTTHWGLWYKTDANIYVPVSVDKEDNFGSSNDKYTYSYTKDGEKVIIEESTGRYTQPTTQFYYKTDATVTKMDALKEAVNAFIDDVAEKSPTSQISIVKFAGKESNVIGDGTYRDGPYTYNYTQVVKVLTQVNSSGATELKDAVSLLNAAGATSSDYGLKKAKDALKSAKQDKVIVLFTDGEPNHSDGFDYEVATTAVNTAKTLKQGKTTIYTVGVFENTTNDINQYMSSVSSNYPDASATVTGNGWKVTNGGSKVGEHYINAENAADLIKAFQTISSEVSSTNLNGSAVVVDKVPSDFTAPANEGDVTLKVANYKADGTFDTAMDAPDEIRASVNGNGTVSVTGFDFSKNWCGLDKNKQACGKKLIIEFTIKCTNYGGTQPTNEGAYIKASSESTEKIIDLQNPTVPVTISLGSSEELLDQLKVEETKTYDGTGFAILSEVAKKVDALVNGTNKAKNAYVNMKLTVTVDRTTYTYKIPVGAESGSWYQGNSADPMTPEQIADVTTPKDVKRDQESNEVEPYTYTFDLKLSDATPKDAESKEYKDNNASFKITPRNVTLTSATDSKEYDGTPLINNGITVGGDGFVKGEGATYNVTGTQTQPNESSPTSNTFTYELKQGTLARNYNITKVEGTLTVTGSATVPVDLATLIQKELTVKKGSTLPNDTKFTVKVTPTGDQPAITGTATNKWENGTTDTATGDTTYMVPFIFDNNGTLSLSAGTHTYTVQETVGNVSGMQYDSKEYTLTITVNNDSTYTATYATEATTEAKSTPLTIQNTYQTPDLTVEKKPYKVNDTLFDADKTVAHVNDQIIWTVSVTNTKTTQASTQLTETLTGATVYDNEACTGDRVDTNGTWTATVSGGKTKTYYVTYKVQATDIPKGKIVNTIVKGDDKDHPIPSDPVSTWDSKQLKSAISLSTSDWTTTVTLTLPTVNKATDNNTVNPVVISKGSYVIDKIGNEFTFMDGLSLKVNDKELSVTQDETNKNLYHFRTETGGTDLYTVTYTAKDGDTPAQFKWEIKENIPAGTTVTLSYKLKLTNHNTAAGTYGVEDLNGNGQIEQGKTPIYTNESAVLYKDADTKLAEFPKPSVSYTIKGSSGGHGGNGGGTVTIPDDVPTGLNGKDHYAYVVGYPDGMVYPQKNITRAEVATIFFRLLKDETREANMTKSNGYNDMKEGAWYTCAVSTLSKMGIIKGYEDGSFKPDASISRAEFAAIAARFDPDGDKTPATFSDVSSHWAKDEISIAANHGWIKGYEDGSFKPDQKITRAETMTLVNRVLKRLPETKDDLHKDMKTWPDNQNESAWFYLAVQEATNSHYQKLKKDGTHETWESMRETRDWAALEK